MEIKVNGISISIENSTPVASFESLMLDIDKQNKILSTEADNLAKTINDYNMLTAIKAAESLSCKSTEGVGEKIATTVKNILEKIKEAIIKLGKFIADIFANGALVTRANMLLNKINKMNDEDINFDATINMDQFTIFSKIVLPNTFIIRDWGKMYKASIQIVIGVVNTLKADSDESSYTDKFDDVVEEFVKDAENDPLLCGLFDIHANANDETENGIFSSHFKPLKALGLNTKHDIVEFLTLVKSRQDPLTQSLKDIQPKLKELTNKVNKIASENEDVSSTAVKGLNMCVKAFTTLTKCSTTVLGMAVSSIGAALKVKNDSPNAEEA